MLVEGPVYEPSKTSLGDSVGLFWSYTVTKYGYNPLDNQVSEIIIMDKKDILRKLLILESDILDNHKTVTEIVTLLQEDQESEPTPLPETPS